MEKQETLQVTVCVSKKQAEFLEEMMRWWGMSRSEYIRKLIDNEMGIMDCRFFKWLRGRLMSWKDRQLS